MPYFCTIDCTKIAPNMKVNEPRISLTLRTNKTLADGTHPIMLRVSFGGMKEKSTGYSVGVGNWDKKKEQIKKGYPNCKGINSELEKIKNEAVMRMLQQKMDGKGFDIAHIIAPESLKGDEVDNDKANTFYRLVRDYLRDNDISRSTANGYKVLEHHLIDCFGDDASKFDIYTFIRYIKNRGVKDSSIHLYIAKLKAIGITVQKKISKQFRTDNRKGYVHYRSFEFIKRYVIKCLESSDCDINDINWEHHGILMFYLILLFQGLSPVDVNNIRKKDILLKFIDGESYYCYSSHRQKTGAPTIIRIRQTEDIVRIIGRLLTDVEGDYLLPFKMRSDSTYKNVLFRCRECFHEDIDVINASIFKHNADDHDDVPLIPSGITYYTARHSYATAVMLKGGNAQQLASLMGRSINGIGTYIKQLSEDSDLVAASNLIQF